MWILNIIPDFIQVYIVHLLITIGIVAIIVGSFSGLLLNRLYRSIVQICGIVLLTYGVYLLGANDKEEYYAELVKEKQAKIDIAEQKAIAANLKTDAALAELALERNNVKIKYKTIIKEVEKIIDANCEVPPIANDLMNSAADGIRPSIDKNPEIIKVPLE